MLRTMNTKTMPADTTKALARLERAVEKDGPTKVAALLGVGLPTLWRWRQRKAPPHRLYVRLILERLA